MRLIVACFGLGLGLGACGGSPPPPAMPPPPPTTSPTSTTPEAMTPTTPPPPPEAAPDAFAPVVALFDGYKTRMCACRDRACADRISEELNKDPAIVKMSESDAKPTNAQLVKIQDLMIDFVNCQMAVESPAGQAKPTPSSK